MPGEIALCLKMNKGKDIEYVFRTKETFYFVLNHGLTAVVHLGSYAKNVTIPHDFANKFSSKTVLI